MRPHGIQALDWREGSKQQECELNQNPAKAADHLEDSVSQITDFLSSV